MTECPNLRLPTHHRCIAALLPLLFSRQLHSPLCISLRVKTPNPTTRQLHEQHHHLIPFLITRHILRHLAHPSLSSQSAVSVCSVIPRTAYHDGTKDFNDPNKKLTSGFSAASRRVSRWKRRTWCGRYWNLDVSAAAAAVAGRDRSFEGISQAW
ncbi:uncharacterized protein B0T23DRAFT_44224 [Neurospora hispaniola]|uniref:Uncharacterized protein n=1 Tax=Neurospora hispaniola TaxID=588809 RepID=A0AAJ0HYI6_9PEZI|nr:hypothetical protein B0T23DRAFT_44224 [Neurospora hispaniola]